MQEFGSYCLLTLSTVLFGFMFFFKDIFRKNYGSGVRATFVTSFGGSIFGFIALVLINGFTFEFTHYAFIMALIATANNLLFTFCSLKSLGKINLSLYSLFSMLGGMVLPFLSGILLHGEALTLAKIVCFLFVAISLFVTVEKGDSKSGVIYYVGVFVFNGMSGVISKIYLSLPFERVSSAGYSMLCALVTIAVCAIVLLVLKGEKRKINLSCILAMAGSGILGKVANLLLLIGLLGLPASAQYPFVTGGTIIVCTIISLFGQKKPSKKEIIAVILAFAGVLLLVLLP